MTDVVVQRAVTEVPEKLLPDNARIERWVIAALGGKHNKAQVTIRIVDNQESQHLNETFRHRTGPTNVLSFPFENPEILQPPLLGDVVICAPLVMTEAGEQGKESEAHWAHLVIHGVLHLVGYDHDDNKAAVIMEELETRIMAELHYPDPYVINEPV